ncbi:MAG: CDP-alcohol phosphatidyltransferase family protein [Planctomycetota bacterium]
MTASLSWPNLISLFRLALVPFFIGLVFQMEEHFGILLGLVVVISASDILDGALARRFGQKTRAGAFLDPLADKVLLVSAFLLLSSPQVVLPPRIAVPLWLAVVVIARDVFLALGSGVIGFATGRIEPNPSAVGKATTFFQVVTIFVILFSDQLPHNAVLIVCVWTAATTCASALDYLAAGWRKMDYARIPETEGHAGP